MTEFTCESCGETFTTESTELEKVAEAERNFGRVPDDPASLCDDCYKEFMKWFNRERPDLRKSSEE